MDQRKLLFAVEAARELTRLSKLEKGIIDDKFEKQARFIRSKARYLAASCTRRAGKSNGLGFKFFNAAHAHGGSINAYLALTRDSAKNIMWPILKEINDRYALGAEFKESTLTVVTHNGSTIKLLGADQRNFINRLKGAKYPFVAIDEAQAFGAHLQDLVDEVIDPAVADYEDGQIALTGTPGPVPKGYFFDASRGQYGFEVHAWTVYENPYFPRPTHYVKELMEKKGWSRDHPTFCREWLGEWVADPDALVYRFNRHINMTSKLPQQDWYYVLGVDLGYDPDPSAFVLCAFSPYEREMFIVDTYKQQQMTVSDVAERIKYYLRKHPTATVVIDAGAQGKMIAEEISQRHDLTIKAAEKHGKAGFIEIMNSDFQKGLIKVVDGVADNLIDEWMNLIWDTEKNQRIEDSRYENHLADAALYAWRYCYNYVQQEKPRTLDRDSEEFVDAWLEKEAIRIASQKTKEGELYGF